MSAETVGVAASTLGLAWAGVSELLPLAPKMIGGMAIAAVAAYGAGKAWLDKLDERRKQDEDRQ
nr:hypothetical protein [Micromonospora sp. DSM 115978]